LAIDLTDVVRNLKEKPQPFEGREDRWYWAQETPQHTFHRVLALTPDRQWAVQFAVNDVFDPALAHAVVDFALSHIDEVRAAKPLAVLAGFPDPGGRFHNLAVAAPAIHISHKAKHPELHARTFVVFPVYRSEIAGRLDKQEAQAVFSHQIPIQDLARDPRPLIRMRYANTGKGVSSAGSVRKITSLDKLREAIERLEGNGSFIDFENFEGDGRTVTWEDGRLYLWHDKIRRPMEKADLLEWARRFTVDGSAAAD
jgi:hypothetical protein